MAISKYRRGQANYTCRVCKKLTRNTGDEGSAQLCKDCFTLASNENALLDGSTWQWMEDGFGKECKVILDRRPELKPHFEDVCKAVYGNPDDVVYEDPPWVIQVPPVATECSICHRPIDGHTDSPTAPWSAPVVHEGATWCTYCFESKDGDDVAKRSIPKESREALKRFWQTGRAWTDNGLYHRPSGAHPGICAGCTTDEAKWGKPVIRK